MQNSFFRSWFGRIPKNHGSSWHRDVPPVGIFGWERKGLPYLHVSTEVGQDAPGVHSRGMLACEGRTLALSFEAKLAQGAAQQVRSVDVYMLNRKLDVFQRFGLFFASIAFYVTNMVMAISISYYILAIVLFAMSSISYHQGSIECRAPPSSRGSW
eukprot:gene10882-biopygen3822